MPKLNNQRTNGGLFLTALEKEDRENSKDFFFLGKQKKITKTQSKTEKPKHKTTKNPKQTNKSKTK